MKPCRNIAVALLAVASSSSAAELCYPPDYMPGSTKSVAAITPPTIHCDSYGSFHGCTVQPEGETYLWRSSGSVVVQFTELTQQNEQTAMCAGTGSGTVEVDVFVEDWTDDSVPPKDCRETPPTKPKSIGPTLYYVGTVRKELRCDAVPGDAVIAP